MAKSIEMSDLARGISKGNPGAMRVFGELMQALFAADASPMESVLMLLLISSRGYTGSALWVLYKDRCECDVTHLMETVMEEAKNEMVPAREPVPPTVRGGVLLGDNEVLS